MASMPPESPENLVDKFLAERTPSRGGNACGTCAHPRVDEINRAIKRFAELKQSGETTHTWKDFHKHVLVPNFDYNLSVWSLRRHVKECLGYE